MTSPLETAERELRERRLDDDLLGFATAMKEADEYGFDWLYFLEKPWKWAAEYESWQLHDCPMGAEAGAVWARWLIDLEEMAG